MRRRLFLLLLVLSGVLLNSIPTHVTAQTCNRGSVRRALYHSDLQDEDMIYTIYLPPCYDQQRDTYPVLYLLHGLRSEDNHWLQLGLLDKLNEGITNGTYPPLIVVMPFGSQIANVNTFGSTSWERTFVTELMPEIESNYRVATTADKRAIGGISRGGFWAYYIALKNPKLFGAVGGHSAAFSLWNAPSDYNPVYLAERVEGLEKIRFWLDRWALDPGRDPMDAIALALVKRNLSLDYRVYENGEHHNRYWSAHLDEYLDFYTEKWKANPTP